MPHPEMKKRPQRTRKDTHRCSTRSKRVKVEKVTAKIDRSNKPVTSKELVVNSKLLDSCIGKLLPKYQNQVKGGVMRIAAIPRVPKFNRMSGIQEFQDAVLLFVNCDQSCYENHWDPNFTEISWFAQPRQTGHSAVIRRLVVAGMAFANHKPKQIVQTLSDQSVTSEEVETILTTTTRIMLFCRRPDERYVNCGRLRLRSVEWDHKPIKVIWQLLDRGILGESRAFEQLRSNSTVIYDDSIPVAKLVS